MYLFPTLVGILKFRRFLMISYEVHNLFLFVFYVSPLCSVIGPVRSVPKWNINRITALIKKSSANPYVWISAMKEILSNSWHNTSYVPTCIWLRQSYYRMNGPKSPKSEFSPSIPYIIGVLRVQISSENRFQVFLIMQIILLDNLNDKDHKICPYRK